MIAHGLPVYVALAPVDMRFGYERLGGPEASTPSSAELAPLFSALQLELAGLKSHLAERDAQIASLRETVLDLTHENALLKRRVYGNKTERAHTSELQLALGDLLNDEKALQKQLDAAVTQAGSPIGDDNAAPPPEVEKTKAKPKGRRDLSTSTLPRFLLEICDEEMEKSCKRIGFDESLQLMYRRGGFSVLVKRTAKYEFPGKDGPTVLGVETPKTLFPRGLLHSSVVACHACVISTDATSGSVQPEKSKNGLRQACKKGTSSPPLSIASRCSLLIPKSTRKTS